MSTIHSELDVKSKDFSIIVDTGFTFVECYEGEIHMTDSISLKTTTLKSGEYASIFGSDGDTNNVIRVYPITEIKRAARSKRINKTQDRGAS
jgi:hypothetical protein